MCVERDTKKLCPVHNMAKITLSTDVTININCPYHINGFECIFECLLLSKLNNKLKIFWCLLCPVHNAEKVISIL